MRWGLTYGEKRDRRPWFAWRPVHLEDGRWAWLEVVFRRRAHGEPSDYMHVSWWEYTTP